MKLPDCLLKKNVPKAAPGAVNEYLTLQPKLWTKPGIGRSQDKVEDE